MFTYARHLEVVFSPSTFHFSHQQYPNFPFKSSLKKSFPLLAVHVRASGKNKYFYFSSMEFTKEMLSSPGSGSERCKAYNLETEQILGQEVKK